MKAHPRRRSCQEQDLVRTGACTGVVPSSGAMRATQRVCTHADIFVSFPCALSAIRRRLDKLTDQHRAALEDIAAHPAPAPEALGVVRDANGSSAAAVRRAVDRNIVARATPEDERPPGLRAAAVAPTPTRSARGRPSPRATSAAGKDIRPAILGAGAAAVAAPSPQRASMTKTATASRTPRRPLR